MIKTIDPKIIATLVGIASGLGTAIFGFIKSGAIDFDSYKFAQTVILFAIIGGIGGYEGMTFDQATQYLANTGIIVGLGTWIEYWKKAAWRKIKPPAPTTKTK